MNVPDQIKRAKALLKPSELPSRAQNVHLDDEVRAWLDTLRIYSVDGQYLWDDEFPTTHQYYILLDLNTNIAWLADSSGFNYPRYIININPWTPRITEMTSSISMGTAPMAAAKKKRKNRGVIVQSVELIGNLLSEADEPENLEKNKFEVVCLDASGREVSTKSFANEEGAQSYIEKRIEKLDDDEVGCSYEIRVVAKGYKDPFAMEESGRDEWYDSLFQRFQTVIKSGDVVALSNALGHDPESVDTDEDDLLSPEELEHDPGWAWDCVRDEFLAGRGQEDPYTTLVIARALGINTDGLEGYENGSDWDALMNELTPRISLTKEADLSEFRRGRHGSRLTECQHGDIIRLGGYLKRDGYYKVDTQDALGASEERPWVENLQDPGTGFYVDPSDVEDMELVISSDEYDTSTVTSSGDVEDILDDDYEDDDSHSN
jgi:hypothetical protein